MEFLQYLLLRSWSWVSEHGLAIAALVVFMVLIPRIRRFVIAIASSNLETTHEESKGHRALIGAIVYTFEVIAYFVIILALLAQAGIALTAAAIPATVISAAIGFGAQGLIGDFLGGIFIIAEKQYGIGDWVEFHSPSGTVQGDVVNMTLRATTIRTMKGEEVIVPNSDARMCVNYSSRWSRAVVEVPVPMTAGGSIKDLEELTLKAATSAVQAPSIKKHVLSEIKLQSSTAINPPTAMGLPWTVTMRLVVDCEPGDQWIIERAVRAAVIDTWWDDYGQRAEGSPLAPAEAVTGYFRDTSMLEQLREDSGETTVLTATPGTSALPDVTRPDATQNTVTGSVVEQQTAQDSDAATTDMSRPDIPTTGARMDQEFHADDDDRVAEGSTEKDSTEKDSVAAGGAGTSDSSTNSATITHKSQDSANQSRIQENPASAVKKWSELTTREKVRRTLSAGGRARPSTVVLLVVLFILAFLNIATVENPDGPNGWLAPSRFNNSESTTSTSPEPTAGDQQSTSDKNDTGTEQPQSTQSDQQPTSSSGAGNGTGGNQTQEPQPDGADGSATGNSGSTQGGAADQPAAPTASQTQAPAAPQSNSAPTPNNSAPAQ